jgi:hypothetical protein
MLFILFNLRSAVEKYCSNYEDELEEDILNFADWKKLRTIKDFLVSFIRATFAAERDFIFINSTFFIIDVLIKYLQN